MEGAQKSKIEQEKLRTQVVRLQEQCASLAVWAGDRKDSTFDTGAVDPRIVQVKDDEIARLQALVHDLELKDQRSSEKHWAHEAADSEQKCQQLQMRCNALERELRDHGKRYAKELSALKMELAKKDARLLELEMIHG